MKIRAIFALRYLIEWGFEALYKTIKKELGSVRSSVLDVGCGIGNFSTLFPHASYTGVDLNGALINYAQRYYLGTFVAGDATKLPFPDKTFTAVFCAGLLHHLDAKAVEVALAEMKRVLKPKGTVVIIEDSRPGWTKNPLIWSLYLIDAGGKFRSPTTYREKLRKLFTIKKDYPFLSGFWRYHVFVLFL